MDMQNLKQNTGGQQKERKRGEKELKHISVPKIRTHAWNATPSSK